MTGNLLRDVYAQTKVMFNEDHPLNKQLRTALAQPEKEWVGLTDEEIAKLRINNSDGNFSLPFSFARAMEALLKEKNA